MNLKKIVALILILALIIGFFPIAINADEKEVEVFFDDFSSDTLDTSKWLVAKKAWGGKNGGVVPENVSISNGVLKLEGHGDLYEGDVEGIKKPDGKRTGAAIATKEYFGSGSYEVVAKVAPELGACSAIWTFEYEEYYPGDEKYEELGATGSYYVVNHEIDIEMPGRPSSGAEPSYEYALCNTWVGEKGSEHTTGYTKLAKAQNDGEFHKYRFDWHTGDEGETPRVEFYFDDELVTTNTTHIPTNKGRLWIGLWFPNGWAGVPDFDTTVFEIDSVKITPFNEAGDTPQNETYGDHGWADIPTVEPEYKALDFDVALSTSQAAAKAGEKISVIAKISEINKNSANGIIVLHGVLKYDKDFLELENISGLGDWKISLIDYNPDNGKFIAVADKFVDSVGDICEFTFKVKEDIEDAKAKVEVTDIEGATAEYKNGIIEAKTKMTEVTIDIEKEKEEEPTYILGDVDGDGTITANDLAKMKLHDIGIKMLDEAEQLRGDLDKDGDVDINDIAMLKLYFIGLIEL